MLATPSENSTSRGGTSSAEGVRLAQKMQAGPRNHVEYSYKRLELAQLLGEFGFFLTSTESSVSVCTYIAPSHGR
jgi:hypothetical protein